MTYAHGNELRADDGTVLATFKSHWQAVAAMIRLSDPAFVSLGGDDQDALKIEAELRERLAQKAAHPILDDVFHGCAFTAFVEEARKAGDWPDSKAVKRRAYELYEEELAKKNGSVGGQVAP